MSMTRAAKLFRIAAIAAAFGLSACEQRSSDGELAKLDNQIVGNDADPALTSALEDQIMVDPSLAQQSNRNAVRTPAAPAQAQYPLPAGGARPAQAPAPGGAGRPVRNASAEDGGAGLDCAPQLDYNAAWARRLPAAFAVYPGSRVTDAAGADSNDCRARVVTFTTAAAPQRVLDHYRSRAAGAGYSAEHQMREGDHILAGTAGNGSAFYLILTPLRGGGSDVAMITKAA